MSSSVDDQVLDFYGELFEHLFSEPFRGRITKRRRLNEVTRQIEAAADAASASLTRFFLSQKLSEETVEDIILGFASLESLLQLDKVSNTNVTVEELVKDLLVHLPCPSTVQKTHDAIYRLALYNIVQVLTQVGPVMAEWQKLNFSSTFELPRRVVNRLNEISSQIEALGQSGQAGADENYELQYRDYLLQRFHKVEAGTVRMTTKLDVDLREIFVMPRIVKRKLSKTAEEIETDSSVALMDLAAARKLYRDLSSQFVESQTVESEGNEPANELVSTILQHVKCFARTVIVGLPGSGKSTFFEWLQVKLASVEEPFILGDQQAIPLLLRVRQLDLLNLPKGAALIEKATASKDRADLMPPEWIQRQMNAGRVLFMLDGLDETEPALRDKFLLPWLLGLLEQYPECHYLISSRPVGYPPGLLHTGKFNECDLLDFNVSQIRDYTRHWCTAVRLARNEPEEEARREGTQDGENIVEGFQDNPYIRDLARNPLMLSAICLVNYFEGGRLPEDRALLYRLCVEGLLHNWDQRRGIHSEFGFDEKLRTCRELALSMQLDGIAECDASEVLETFTNVLNDSERAVKLLEHIRYRTGLLLERRPDVFGFAHLTFQEYLAARAVHEGNRLDVDVNQLVAEHDDGRWKEVTALYSGLATTPAARSLVDQLVAQSDTKSLGEVLTEAYISVGSDLAQDQELRKRVLKRVATAPGSWKAQPLNRFPAEEVAPVANALVGATQNSVDISESHVWLVEHPAHLEVITLAKRLKLWKSMTPIQVSELIHLIHMFASDELLMDISSDSELYNSEGPIFHKGDEAYHFQAEVALIGLAGSNLERSDLEGFHTCFRQIAQVLLKAEKLTWDTFNAMRNLLERKNFESLISLQNVDEKQGFASLLKKLSFQMSTVEVDNGPVSVKEEAINGLNQWVKSMESEKDILTNDNSR
ncbi:MAG: NACHT domain-containing protein [Cyanobacteria bacterium J06560_6]